MECQLTNSHDALCHGEEIGNWKEIPHILVLQCFHEHMGLDKGSNESGDDERGGHRYDQE